MASFETDTSERTKPKTEFFSQVKLLQKFYANYFKSFEPDIENVFKKNIKKTLRLSSKGLTFGDKVSEVLTGIPFEHVPFDAIRSIYQDEHYPTILICVITSKNPRYHYEIITYLASRGHYAKQFERTFDEISSELRKAKKYPPMSQSGLSKNINIPKTTSYVSSNCKHTLSRSHQKNRNESSSISITGESRPQHLKFSKPFDEDESVLSGFTRNYPSSVIDFTNTNKRYQNHLNSYSTKKNKSSFLLGESPKENSKYSTEARIFVNGKSTSQRPILKNSFNEKFENFGLHTHKQTKYMTPHQEETKEKLDKYKYASRESLLQNSHARYLNQIQIKNEPENFNHRPRNQDSYASSTIKKIVHVKSEPRFHYTQQPKQNYQIFSKDNYQHHSRGPSRNHELLLTLQRSPKREHTRQNRYTKDYAPNLSLHKF